MIFLISLLRALHYRSSRLFCPYFGILFLDFFCSGHYFTEVTGLSAPASVFSLLISLLRALLYRSNRLFCPYFGILAFDFSCSGLYTTEVAGFSAFASVFSFLISSAQGSTLPK